MRPGDTFGRYVIEAELGQGGQAVVYRAHQPSLGRRVALKVFDRGTFPGSLERFRREALTAASLEHPRIVPVYDADEVDGRPFIAMRLIAGESLADRIARLRTLPPADVARVISQTAQALAFAHDRQITHRDVKPANILLDAEGYAFLSDFGLARPADATDLTRAGDVVGTFAYIAPELVHGEQATPASDLYALAATAYESLVGRPPFTDTTPAALFMAHVQRPVPPPSALNPHLQPGTDAVLLRGLAKSPRDRFGSVTEFAGALAATLAGAPVTRVPEGPPDGPPATRVSPPFAPPAAPGAPTDALPGRSRRRTQVVAGAVAGGLAALAGGAVLVALTGGGGDPARGSAGAPATAATTTPPGTTTTAPPATARAAPATTRTTFLLSELMDDRRQEIGARCFGTGGNGHNRRTPSFNGREDVEFIQCGEIDGTPDASGVYVMRDLPEGTLVRFDALFDSDDLSLQRPRQATVTVRLNGRTVCTARIAGNGSQRCRSTRRIPTGGEALEIDQRVTPQSPASGRSLFVGLVGGSVRVEVPA